MISVTLKVMRFNVKDPFAWDQLNLKVKQAIGCESKVMVYRGIHQALFEITMGLHIRFGHKRKIVAKIGFGDHLHRTELELSKQGVRIKTQFDEGMDKEEKNTLAYIHDLDDSVTGDLYNNIETLKQVAATKIYRIHVAHHLFHFKKNFVQKLSEYDLCVCSIDRDYALVFCGDKITLPQLSAQQLPWDPEVDSEKILNIIEAPPKEFQKEIISFETSLPPGIEPWFTKAPCPRIYDRAVVSLKNMDAFAFMELFYKENNLEMHRPMDQGIMETTSYCRWQNDLWFQQASQFSRTEDQMRGLLCIDGKAINSEFTEKFKKAYENLKKLSS